MRAARSTPADRCPHHPGKHNIVTVAADQVGAGGVLLRPQARQGQRIGRRRQRLARAEHSIAPAPCRAAYRNLQPAGIALERVRTKVQVTDGEQTAADGDARFGLGRADLRPTDIGIPQAELEIARPVHQAAVFRQLALIGKRRAHQGLGCNSRLC